MKRKDFIKKIAFSSVIIPTSVLFNGCGEDEEDATPLTEVASCVDNGTQSNIDQNHGHRLTVSKEDVQSGTTKSYDITGTGSHPHRVTISEAEFTELSNGKSITVTTSVDANHSHSVRVSCA